MAYAMLNPSIIPLHFSPHLLSAPLFPTSINLPKCVEKGSRELAGKNLKKQ